MPILNELDFTEKCINKPYHNNLTDTVVCEGLKM